MSVIRERIGENPVSVGLFIAHANLEDDDCSEGDRELYQMYLDTALDMVERYSGRAFVEQEVSVDSDVPVVHLPVTPFDYLISGSLEGEDIDRDLVCYDKLSNCCKCDGYSDLGPRSFSITYAPRILNEPAAKQAILQIATWLNENKGDVDPLAANGIKSTIMSSGATALLDPLRNLSIM